MKTIPLVAVLALSVLSGAVRAGQETKPAASALKITVLSTMVSGNPREGVGEWGFAALVEAGDRRLLVDTGGRPDTVLRNAAELGIDLSTVVDVVITHNHGDHTAGLLTLRRELQKRNPAAISRVHVGEGIFLPRRGADGRDSNGLTPLRREFEATGGTFIEHQGPAQLMPGLWFTGPIPRVHPERNWSGGVQLQTAAGPVEDTVPEDSSVIVQTADGLVVITGCGHAGVINILERARASLKTAQVHAVIGGLHLFAAADEQLAWTAGKLREFGVRHLLGAHCTGFEAVYRLRERAGLTRQTAVVGVVGSSFTAGRGIDPRQLAR